VTIDPKWRFIISIAITFAIGVSQGTVVLTNAIPADFIKPVVAWCGIFAFIGSAANTAISGLGMTTISRVAAASSLEPADKIAVASTLSAGDKIALAASVPQVQQIVTTPQLANAAGPVGDGAKVVSKS
jgi:hypothetical protein